VKVDVVELIMSDHREAERLFGAAARRTAVAAAAGAGAQRDPGGAHRAEEAAVCPAAKAEAGETEEIAHGQHEHADAEQLPAKLVEADPGAASFEKAPPKLVDAVTHHVRDEESTELPRMRERLSGARRG
jgi:hypothetical protein